MITFTARLYDATNEVWIDQNYNNYTIAYYNFDVQVDTLDNNLKFTLDTSRLDVDHSNNFLSHMVYNLFKRRYDNLGTEVVRLCISSATTNYFEIRYSDPQTIYVCETETDVTPIPYMAWFVEYGSNEEPTLQRAPFAWVNKVQTESLNPALASGIYYGSVHSDANVGPLVYAVMCTDTSFYLKGDTRFYVGDMDTVLAVHGAYSKVFTKTNNVPAMCVYCERVNGYYGPLCFSYLAEGSKYNVQGGTRGPYSTEQLPDADGNMRTWYYTSLYWDTNMAGRYYTQFPVFDATQTQQPRQAMEYVINLAKPVVVVTTDKIYVILQGTPLPPEPEPTPDQPNVDPDNIPPADEEPEPTTPDDPDPYYDPESDPGNPEYKPSKDPNNPSYDPSTPDTSYTPPSSTSEKIPEVQPTQDTIATPETPPSYATSNDMFTLYNPSGGGDLTNLANFLWSNTWSVDTFKKIFANPMDCILGLMVMPQLGAAVSTKVMNIGNISSGVTLHYFISQFYDFDCGTFKIEEYYNSYLDYSPYTKVNIFLPFIGDHQLNTDEVMNKTIGVKYRFDIGTGDCIAFITVDGSVLYSFSGNCAARLPISGNNWNGLIPAITGAVAGIGGMAAGVPALGAASALAVTSMKETISHSGSLSGSPGLMGVQTPYLIISRPRQVLPINQNSYTGYPSFITESLGSLSGYTEVEACHIEHVPATGAELEEIERLLKGGVVF